MVGHRRSARGARLAFAALATAATLGLVACSSDPDAARGEDSTTSTTTTVSWATEPLGLTPATTAPAGLGEDVEFYQDVRCGDAERNVIDVAVPAEPDEQDQQGEGADAAGEDPSIPLVIHLHGGGFTAGDKSGLWEDDEVGVARELLDRGVAVASMNYTLLAEVDPDGVRTPLLDAARCLQFVRYHGPATFGIDPELVALRGGSAGAGTSLWLATHDDLADPGADDPVLRQSTKPLAVVAHETQATYDLVRWSTDVFTEYDELFGGKNLIELAQAFGLSQRLLSFYGITDPALLESEEILEYRADVDVLGLMDAEDPPAWIANTREEDAVPVSVGLLFHHADHARALQARAAQVGYDATVTAGPGQVPETSEVDYLLAAFDAA